MSELQEWAKFWSMAIDSNLKVGGKSKEAQERDRLLALCNEAYIALQSGDYDGVADALHAAVDDEKTSQDKEE